MKIKLCLVMSLLHVSLMAQVCSNPQNTFYGLSFSGSGGSGFLHPISVNRLPNTVSVGGAINTILSTPGSPDNPNGLGFNAVNGKFYFFNQNNPPTLQFVSYDPALASYTLLSNPAGVMTTILRGCTTRDGSGYYCIDGQGKLLYYDINTDSWTTIISDENQYVFESGVAQNILSSLSSGDMAFDQNDNLWLLPANGSGYAIFKILNPVPKTSVANLAVKTVLNLTPNPTVGSGTFVGLAFSLSGEAFVCQGQTNGHLFRVEIDLSLTDFGQINSSSVRLGDLSSCTFPFVALSDFWKSFNILNKSPNQNLIEWSTASKMEGLSGTHFQIEYSLTGFNWISLANIYYRSYENKFSYVHRNLPNGRIFYRVKYMGQDGVITKTAIRTTHIESSSDEYIQQDLASNNLIVRHNFPLSNSGNSLILCNTSGQILKRIAIRDTNTYVSLDGFPPGIYIAKLLIGKGLVKSKKVLVFQNY